ncbi:hypothetical protein [Cryobacterium roopkundense]|uniref:Cation transport ATPase n=1 Tax=Cryobacterium roopkundense TaxID=1001240 RepID=A0A7W8ZWW8_9MICO|nr:hypothetical protein [Cryobacterium roopkundense]MBB5641686.1 cation transport ATPase [Cryobacterium roopkundense]
MIEGPRRAQRYVAADLIFTEIFITVLLTWDLISTLTLALAVAGHEDPTVIVALNDLRLVREKPWPKAFIANRDTRGQDM